MQRCDPLAFFCQFEGKNAVASLRALRLFAVQPLLFAVRQAQMYSPNMDPEISVDQLKSLLASGTPPLVLDVREPWEYETAHIAGSTLIPMNEIPARFHNELDEDQPIAVLCHHGARSLNVTMWLRNQGFTHTQSVAGGIDHWSRVIDSTVPRY